MHVLVVGAGIIGSIYGRALAESGHHVVHLVRSGRAAALSDGLTLDMFDRRKRHKRNFRGTIADLENSPNLALKHIAEDAIQYRSVDIVLTGCS